MSFAYSAPILFFFFLYLLLINYTYCFIAGPRNRIFHGTKDIRTATLILVSVCVFACLCTHSFMLHLLCALIIAFLIKGDLHELCQVKTSVYEASIDIACIVMTSFCSGW